MGCGNSKNSQAIEAKATKSAKLRRKKSEYVSEDLNGLQKIKMIEAIKKNDPVKVEILLHKIKVEENLTVDSDNQTTFHVAAENNAFQTLPILFTKLRETNSENFKAVCNIQNYDLRTPLMIAAANDAVEAFKCLYEEGENDLSLKDSTGKTVQQLAQENSYGCREILSSTQASSSKGKSLQQIEDDERAKEEEERKRYEDEKKKKEEELHKQKLEELEKRKLELAAEEEKQKKIQAEIERQQLEEEKRRKLEELRAEQEALKRQQEEAERKKKQEEEEKLRLEQEALSNANSYYKDVPPDSKVHSILDKLKGGDTIYDDPDFPPNVNSITKNKQHGQYDAYFKDAPWKRVHEIVSVNPSEVKLFDEIEPNDIDQGLLGVCYCLATLSATAEFPARLMRCFITKQANPHGVYALRLYIRGLPTEIIVDDKFPCYPDSRGALFSKPKGAEAWVLVAEKAFCKQFGTYTMAEAGQPKHAMEVFHGCPSETYRGEELSDSETWERIKIADKNNFLITCSTGGSLDESTGLVAGHAYTIISAAEHNGIKLLKIRNPWGKGEWKGDYSDKSSKWTYDLKQKFQVVDEEDGAFFMELRDFRSYFKQFDIGYYHDSFIYNSFEDQFNPRHANYYKFFVSKTTEVYFRTHQEDKRNHQPDSEDIDPNGPAPDGYDYSPVDFVLLRLHEGDLLENVLKDPENEKFDNLAFGARSVYLNKDMKVTLEKGEYILRAKIPWRDKKEKGAVISTYSSREIKLNKIDLPDFREKYYKFHGKTLESQQDFIPNCTVHEGWLGDAYCYYVDNKSDSTVEIECTYTKLENLAVGKFNRTSNESWKVVVPPQNNQIAYLKRQDPAGAAGQACKYSISTS